MLFGTKLPLAIEGVGAGGVGMPVGQKEEPPKLKPVAAGAFGVKTGAAVGTNAVAAAGLKDEAYGLKAPA